MVEKTPLMDEETSQHTTDSGLKQSFISQSTEQVTDIGAMTYYN